MRVGIDATPLLGQRTGIGRYVEGLLGALSSRPDVSMVPTAFSVRGRGGLPGVVPLGMKPVARPAPANLLQQLWMRANVPPVEAIGGRVDVFHATNYVLPPLLRAKGILTIHDLTYLRLPETVQGPTRRFETLVPRGLKRAALVITDAQAIAEEVAEAYSWPMERIVVAPLGIDPVWASAAPPEPSWLESRGIFGPYVVAVGSKEPRKGLPSLLRALAELPDGPPLALVGPPGWGPELSTAGLAPDRVVELGYLSDLELRSVVAGAACLVYPSLYEGFGFPPLEAMAAGTPVVASDIPVLREVCGPHARFAPVGDSSGLASCLAAVLSEGGPTTSAARRAWAATYTWERCAALTMEAYRRAVS